MLRRAVLASIAAGLCFVGAACAADDDPLTLLDSQLEPIKWSDIEGWTTDDHLAAFATYRASCQPFLALRKRPRDERPVYGALWEVCRRAAALKPADATAARSFFEDNFR